MIPGAVRVDPLDMRFTTVIVMPMDLDLVLYCRSENRFVSARVATVMRKNGIRRIRVLEGDWRRGMLWTFRLARIRSTPGQRWQGLALR